MPTYLRIKLAHHALRFLGQLRDEGSVSSLLLGLIKAAANDLSFVVDNKHTLHTLVRLDALDTLLCFGSHLVGRRALATVFAVAKLSYRQACNEIKELCHGALPKASSARAHAQ